MSACAASDVPCEPAGLSSVIRTRVSPPAARASARVSIVGHVAARAYDSVLST